MNLIVDLLYYWLDPRLRQDKAPDDCSFERFPDQLRLIRVRAGQNSVDGRLRDRLCGVDRRVTLR